MQLQSNLIFKKISIILVFTFIYTQNVLSEQDEQAVPETKYLGPQDLTKEDRAMLIGQREKYHQCLNGTVQRELNNYDDPRVLVDIAMKNCAIEMENLYNWMTLRNIEPGFKQGYIRQTSNRAVNQLLRVVMVQMAAKNETDTSSELSEKIH